MNKATLSIIGLGYVGLPVAISFSRKYKTIGFDINQRRIEELKNFIDITREVSKEELQNSTIVFTNEIEDLREANIHIVAVPTPINDSKQPNLGPIASASETVGKILKKGDIVIYESTVYPGLTEDFCQEILERVSGLKGGVDFKLGYSPERINPGDKEHTFEKIVKVVSAQDQESLKIVSDLYSSVVTAGVYKASSIKVAEAAKIIENTQRDVNIALMNELAIIFERLNISASEVLEAAATKWNFLKFTPGLVGGHCIGVDPYYLTYKAEMLGYHPQVILSGRRINDNMGKFIAEKTVKMMLSSDISVNNSMVTILGLTFKENCPDLRNTKVVDIITELKDYGIKVQVFDPVADEQMAESIYGVSLTPLEKLQPSSAVIGAVKHQEIINRLSEVEAKVCGEKTVCFDVKNFMNSKRYKKIWTL